MDSDYYFSKICKRLHKLCNIFIFNENRFAHFVSYKMLFVYYVKYNEYKYVLITKTAVKKQFIFKLK